MTLAVLSTVLSCLTIIGITAVVLIVLKTLDEIRSDVSEIYVATIDSNGYIRASAEDDYDLETTVWFADDSIKKDLTYFFRPSVGDTLTLDVGCDELGNEKFLEVTIDDVVHNGEGDVFVHASIGAEMSAYRDSLLSGGWSLNRGGEEAGDAELQLSSVGGGDGE